MDTLFGLSNLPTARVQVTLRQRLEYAALRLLVGMLRLLPRNAARAVGAWMGMLAGRVAGKLSSAGEQNLQIAFPKLSAVQRNAILEKTFRNLGWLLAEFCQMARYTPEFAQNEVMRYEGLEHYRAAKALGKGVLVLTGHLGAWELSSFVHSLLGEPMGMVIRRLDNPLVDNFVNGIRCMHGNTVLHKDDFARGLITAMHRGEAVGILMDTNMTPPQGVFVPFFGIPACTGSGLARIARKTGAAVIPGFLLWSEAEQCYVLTFGEELALQKTHDAEADALENTALFASVTEQYIRNYPDQWLWLHRRWKTRPAGEPPIYKRTSKHTTAEAQLPESVKRSEAV